MQGVRQQKEMMKIILTNIPENKARDLARRLVEGKMAACVNLVPGLLSIYGWKGKIEEDSETQLLIKTTEDRLSEAVAFIKKNHPYEVPEIAVIDISSINPEYLNWLKNYVEKS